MALTNLVTSLVLDVHDHDTTPTSVKAIALDKQTRFIKATLTYRGADYPVDENATVTLTVIRPDKTGVQVTGSVVDVDNADRTGTIKGVYAELSQTALAVRGKCLCQFKITDGEQILRTEIFAVNNGQALDADISEWAGDLDGHNLDEMAQSIEDLSSDVSEIQSDVSDLKEELTIAQMQTALYNVMNLVAFRPVKSTRYQGNATNNGITYEWYDDNTCTVSGTASSLSFNNIYSDNTHFPSWLKKGETYVFKGGTNVSLEVYFYKSGTYYYGLSVKNTEREYTIPVDIDGLIMRLQVANGVTVNETIQPICRKKDMPSNGELYNLLYTPISIEDLEWTYGGLDSAGYQNASDKRIRYKAKAGRGAFWVSKGTEISAASGYKFNAALYSDYQGDGNFTLIGYRGTRIGTYTVPQDCYIRVAVGTTADDMLWTMTDNVKSFTAAGIAAQSALTITGLTPIPLNERVENLENQLNNGIITPFESAIELKDEIPLNAMDFHALFNDFVNNGKVTRTLLANIGDDSKYPVYLYTLRNDMNHIATDYSRVIWDGSNELYQRPKIWLTGGIHGNERTMPFVIYSFIENLVNNVYYQEMLNAFDWYFVPLVNPWGFSHSARDKTTGDWIGGGAYTAETKDNYDVYENTVEHHQGIRSVESGLDANRDFTTFATQEARLIRDALVSLTADNRNFAFAIDAHQSTGGSPSAVNALGAFMSTGYNAPQSVKELLFGKWMQAGAKTESIMANYCGVNNVQTVFTWDGTSDARIMRNFLQTFTDNAMCYEGGQTCVYYSGTTNWSNDVARTFSNTQYQQFLKKLTEHWM